MKTKRKIVKILLFNEIIEIKLIYLPIICAFERYK